MIHISTGPINRAQKVVIYGVEGIGKTTLASQVPDPLFIDTEGGTSHLDVKRTQPPEDWGQLLDMVREVAATPDICKSLVIDTADWAEQMAIDYICKKYKQTGLEAFGYGKGYTYLGEEFGKLLAACDDVIHAGINVVIIAHARQRRVELPDETGGFDVWGLKLSKQCAPMLKEWADALLFANYKTFVVQIDANHNKAQGGKRVIYTTHSPTRDAKNRHGLPDEVDMTYEAISPIFSSVQAPSAAQELRDLLNGCAFTEAELVTFVNSKKFFDPVQTVDQLQAKFIREWVIPNFDQIADKIVSDPKRLPF